MKTSQTFAARLWLGAALLMLAGICVPAPTRADSAPPERMVYQGFLTDSLGAPLGATNPAIYSVRFFIYDTESGGGNVKWAESQTVAVDKGNFSVLLGEGTTISTNPHAALSTVFTGANTSDRYVEMRVADQVNGEYVIAPRLRLLPTAYAFSAVNAKNISADDGTLLVYSSGANLTVKGLTSLGIGGAVTASSARVNGSVAVSGAVTSSTMKVTGAVVAGSVSGDGSGLTSLNASAITSGSLALARIPNMDAAHIPNLDASKITSGTLDAARLPNVPTGPENLQIIRGTVNFNWASPIFSSIAAGSGFTQSSAFPNGSGIDPTNPRMKVTLTFSTPFSGTPSFIFSSINGAITANSTYQITDNSHVVIQAYAGGTFDFIAIGPR